MKYTKKNALMGAGSVLTLRAESDPIEKLMKAFAEFKTANDDRLNSLESKGTSDVLVNEKVDRIDAAMSEFEKQLLANTEKMAQIEMGAGEGGDISNADPAYSSLFSSWMRTGDGDAAVRSEQHKGVRADLQKGVPGDGGYVTPTEWDRTITDRVVEISPMRQLATIQRVGVGSFTKQYNMKGTTSGWVGETGARPTTATPTFGEQTFTIGEIYASPRATQAILDDALLDVATWLANEVDQEFAVQENRAFVNGNGTNKPFGVLSYIAGNANAGGHPWGPIEAIEAAGATIAGDDLLDMIYALQSSYTSGASFIANRTTIGALRKLKDSEGNYLWSPSLTAGEPSTLLGYGIRDVPDMPAVGASSTPLMFGNFKRGYLILDRVGVRVMRDPYSVKPYVLFYTTKRLGGGVNDPDALKALQMPS